MPNFEDIFTPSNSIESMEDSAASLVSKLSSQPEIAASSQVGFDPKKLVPAPTYVEVGIEKLTAMCEGLGLERDKTTQAIEIFRGMTTSWGDKQVGDVSGWRSDVSDDGAPFEFSIAFKEDRAELRFLLEAQGKNNDLQSNWQAGLELNQYLADNFGISLDRFQQIQDLFAPNNAESKLAMWHAVCIYPDKEPAFKIYLNPQAQGASKAAAVVEESFVRLGFTHAWMGLAETAAQRGPDRDDFIYFSLDLAADAKARVKVYLRHFDATPTELDAALSLADNYVTGKAIEFCQAMAPGQVSFCAKPAITCFSWVEGNDWNPNNGTLYLPISNYATDDREVCDRIDLCFLQYGIPVSKYQAVIQAGAKRSLNAGIGMHSYVALRQQERHLQISVYINPEVNGVKSPGKIADSQVNIQSTSLEEMASYYENYPLHHHPFFQRLEREPVNTGNLWLLLMNFRDAVAHFSRRLANIIARIEDERICCILTKQLNDELGNGNIDGIHRKLFERLMSAIDDWQIPSYNEDMLIPGKEFSKTLEEIYCGSSPYVGIGAAILLEIYGEQFDPWLGKELRKTNIDLSAMTWVTLHEELEMDHADESLVMASFVAESPEGVKAATAGISKARVASWKFLNDLYSLCYGA